MVGFSTICRASMEYYLSLNSPSFWIPETHTRKKKKKDLLNLYLFWILIFR